MATTNGLNNTMRWILGIIIGGMVMLATGGVANRVAIASNDSDIDHCADNTKRIYDELATMNAKVDQLVSDVAVLAAAKNGD